MPASSALHAGLTHLPPLAGAGLAAGPGRRPAPRCSPSRAARWRSRRCSSSSPCRPAPAGVGRRDRRELLARSGADLLLVAFAAVGWWQLHAQPDRSERPRRRGPGRWRPRCCSPPAPRWRCGWSRPRCAAPTGWPAAPAGWCCRWRRSRRPAGPQAVAAGLLIGLACAAGTFGIAFDATWHRSQHDQADLSVGTDLALTLAAPPVAGEGAARRRGHRRRR